ncbi:21508_t:CDS:1, partial [Racocetra persica]
EDEKNSNELYDNDDYDNNLDIIANNSSTNQIIFNTTHLANNLLVK